MQCQEYTLLLFITALITNITLISDISRITDITLIHQINHVTESTYIPENTPIIITDITDIISVSPIFSPKY